LNLEFIYLNLRIKLDVVKVTVMVFLNIPIDFLIFSILYSILYSILVIICILVAVAYFTLLDRKVMAAMQRRRGPNVVGL